MPQQNFDLTQFLPYLLNQAAEASSLSFQREYKARYGMLRTDWRVLFHLGLYGQMTAKQIGQKARVHKTKISRAVQHLQDLRLLDRTRDTTDRRVEHLYLTAKGQAAYHDLSAVAARYDAALTKDLSETEVALLRSILRKLARG